MLESRHEICSHSCEETNHNERGEGREPLGSSSTHERVAASLRATSKERKDPRNEMDQRHRSTVPETRKASGYRCLQSFSRGGDRRTS